MEDLGAIREQVIALNKKRTNADRLRAMSDEELARWITSIDHDNPCPPDNSCFCSTSNCTAGWLAWLKKEVET